MEILVSAHAQLKYQNENFTFAKELLKRAEGLSVWFRGALHNFKQNYQATLS